MDYDQHFETSARLRNDYWNSIGKLHEDVITHAINPAFSGGPMWPSVRQAFVRIDTPSGTILASDGLSDPYSDFDENESNRDYNGVGCEFYIECNETLGDFNHMKASWQFSVLYQVAQLAAGNPNIASIISDYTHVSTELYDCDVPDSFLNEDGRAGVLLGLTSPVVTSNVQLSIENIALVNVRLLTLQELQYINEHGEAGRAKIAELLSQNNGVSDLTRPSVI